MQAIQLDPNTYQELEILRNKLWSLQETFSVHITYLKEPKYPFTWPNLLNKFNMLTAKFASLSEDFYHYTEKASTATLPKLMIHPYIPTTTEQETNILSVLLRTKLIPDIEKLEAETQAAIARDLVDPNQNSTARIDDEQLIKTQLDQWNGLTNQIESDEEGEDEEEEKEKEEEWEKMGFPSEEVWKKWRLECLMNFYSSGKSEVMGSDLKKLATAVKK
ncbi:unnamed protein product [Rhizopus stolonifer]